MMRHTAIGYRGIFVHTSGIFKHTVEEHTEPRIAWKSYSDILNFFFFQQGWSQIIG